MKKFKSKNENMKLKIVRLSQSIDNVSLTNALEIIKYCLYDGKVDQGSTFETKLYKSLVTQISQTVSLNFEFKTVMIL